MLWQHPQVRAELLELFTVLVERTDHRHPSLAAHAELGTSIMLFARERQADRAFWFLGPATYVRHEGERPMAITWKLAHPLPGDLFASFAAAVA